jgi:carbon-monoxide dehydrogenase medium subunit
VVGPGGARAIDLIDALGADGLSLAPAELVVAVELPAPAARIASAYATLREPASLGALCGVAATVGLAAGGSVSECRVAVTGAANAPMVLAPIGEALRGKPTSASAVAAAVGGAVSGVTARSDLAASADYRAHLIQVLAEDAINAAIARARAA